jgi:hypothetical protein
MIKVIVIVVETTVLNVRLIAGRKSHKSIGKCAESENSF